MGCVYEGRANLRSGASHPVAIKLLGGEHAGNPDVVRLFDNEALTTLALNHNHPNLVTTYASHTTSIGQPYLVMEYVDGVCVDVLAREKIGDDETFFAVVRRIAQGVLLALDYLHTHGVIHRDVSPGNILLGRDGAVKLADMGLCKALEAERSQVFAGTPAYACPEALAGGKPEVRFDLFSLAVVLYELFTGNKPFGTGEPQDVFDAMAQTEEKPSLPGDVPSDLATLVLELLSLDARDAGLQSAKDCLALLQDSADRTADNVLMGMVVAQFAARNEVAKENKNTTIPVLFPPRPGRMLRWALASGAAALIFALGLTGGSMLHEPTVMTRSVDTRALHDREINRSDGDSVEYPIVTYLMNALIRLSPTEATQVDSPAEPSSRAQAKSRYSSGSSVWTRSARRPVDL